MLQDRLTRLLARGAVISWREQPTQYDIEALRANIERVGLVIRVRWVIVAVLVVYSIVAALIYTFTTGLGELAVNMANASIALGFVLVYNGIFQRTYRQLGNIAYFNQVQLLLDIVVATTLVYFSGGVNSWFGAMYVIFILEGTFILLRPGQVWTLVVATATAYGFVLVGEYVGWFQHVPVPFVPLDLHRNLTLLLVQYLWHVALFAGAAMMGMLMMRSVHERETELRESSFVDDLTGLYDRSYFHRVLPTELQRARRAGRSLGLIIADVDDLGSINRTFGLEIADALLIAVAERLKAAGASGYPETERDFSIACRVGGEEFALIVPEVLGDAPGAVPFERRLFSIAEEFRSSLETTRASGVSVTVSVGIAMGPADGETPDALFDAADRALARATERGGNTIEAAVDVPAGDRGSV